ncbi:MAG: adenine deaminase [Planctomycetota bacterium]
MPPRHPAPDPELMRVARGEAPADVSIMGARVVNVFTRELVRADVAIKNGRFACVGPARDAETVVDSDGAVLFPGFIDAHMHIESTMTRPAVFATLASPHATTGAVADPHEIANVLGIPGIRWMMDDARDANVRIFWTASPCVPSCHLEHADASLSADDLAPLFDDERVVALAEMMNFPGAAHADPEVVRKVALGLERALVDGHAPGLSGDLLQAYACAGISSDHECTTAPEALEKLRLGMRVYIREGSAARNLEALLPVVTPANAHRFCFCTDDRHPDDLRAHGHIDHVVRSAIALGLDPCTAIAMGSHHTATHYRLPALGAIAPGYHADCALTPDLERLDVEATYLAGVRVSERGRCLREPAVMNAPPEAPVRLPDDLNTHRLRIGASTRVRVIGMDPTQLLTAHETDEPTVRDDACVADPSRDLLKLAVVERHAGTGNVGLALVRGFGLARGAIASTVGHDAHNLALLGADDDDMLACAHELARVGGGQCAALGGEILATLPLPIAGLMSDRPADEVIAAQRALLDATRDALGCPHHDPFMPLSFMPLPVIPHLKVTDLGLVDVDRFGVVPISVS